MARRGRAGIGAAIGCVVCVVCAGPAPAQDFYAGKSLNMIIGVSPGGGYDLWGRTVARHIVNYLPGKPAPVPQNMPGAGTMTALNYIYNVAPKDGTVMGIVARDAPLAALQGTDGARFDATKLSWIGTPALETNVCVSWHGARAKKFDDLLTTEMILGTVGPGSGSHNYPKALNGLLGTKFKLIPGFPGSADVFLAMERGEVEGFCESLDSVTGKRPDWIRTGKVNVLFQGAARPNPEIPQAPFIFDLAKTPDVRAALDFLYAGQGIGRPFVAPPDLPPARLQNLRDAFDAMLSDADFIADARKQGLDMQPRSGAELDAFVKKIFATPKEIVARVAALVKQE